MIEVNNLTKHYGNSKALEDVSFTIKEGEIVGLLGPNGAGKSTTMNIITGYLSATSGNVTVMGKNILDEPNEVKKMIGYLPEIPPLYLDMTVKEYLSFIYDLKKVKTDKPKTEHIKEICEITKISDVYKRIIGNLSKGYRQRVGIAQALLGNPPVLILDEPTVGLDPNQIIEIRNLITSLGEKHTVILSSHILSEIQAVCERILVISDGKLVANGTADELAKSLSGDNFLLAEIEGDSETIKNAILSIENVTDVEVRNEKETGVFEYRIKPEEGSDIRRNLFNVLSENNMPLLSLKSTELTLEEVFIKLTNGDTFSNNEIEDKGGEEE